MSTMLLGNSENDHTFTKLIDLVRNFENNEIKSIIKKANPSDLVDSSGTLLIHLSAKYNNVELIDFLLSSGHDIESKTNLGITPIMMSAIDKSYTTLRYLLNADANIFSADNNNLNTLQVILKAGKRIPLDIFASLRDQLRRRIDSTEKIADLIVKADGKVESVILLNDIELMKEMLKHKPFERKIDNRDLIVIAVEFGLADIIGVLVQRGYKSLRGQRILMKKLSKMMTNPNQNLDVLKPIVENLVVWGIIDDAAMKSLQKIFREGSQKAVEMILDSQVVSYVKMFLREDFFWYIFRNPNLDVLELLENRWDVNEQDKHYRSLLHHGVMCKSINTVRRLLDLGADPDIEDKYGRTPLLFVKDSECLELLIERGANVSTVDYKSNTIVGLKRRKPKLLQIVIAHMVLAELPCGDDIIQDDKTLLLFNQSQNNLYWMKKQKIFKDSTLYDFLEATDDTLIIYPIQCLHSVSDTLKQLQKDNEFNSYFIKKIEKQLLRAFAANAIKLNIAIAVAECLEVSDPKHLVVEKIINFLSYEDIFVCL